MTTSREIKRVEIQTIPHAAQRYNTVGDWSFAPAEQPTTGQPSEGDSPSAGFATDVLLIKVSDTGNWKWNMLIALHEFCEAVLCTESGVSPEQVDVFDMAWKQGFGFEEPGDDPRAPYYFEHQTAEMLEQDFFDALFPYSDGSFESTDWKEYEEKLGQLSLDYETEKKEAKP